MSYQNKKRFDIRAEVEQELRQEIATLNERLARLSKEMEGYDEALLLLLQIFNMVNLSDHVTQDVASRTHRILLNTSMVRE